MARLEKIIIASLLIVQNSHAMLRVANNPLLKQRAAQALRKRQAAIIGQCIQNVLADPHYIENDWQQNKSIAFNQVAQAFNVADPAQLPPAIDVAKGVLFYFAPKSQKTNYLLINGCLNCQTCDLPYACTSKLPRPPAPHTAKLYNQTLKLEVFPWNNSRYVRRAPYLPEHLNSQLIRVAALKTCDPHCPDCQTAKLEVGVALRKFTALVENDSNLAKATALRTQKAQDRLSRATRED